METALRDHITFFREFRDRFETTGAIAPSSRFLARAMTSPMQARSQPARILEIGPGTGAVTRRIVKLLGPDDRFDLVELNETFARVLKDRFERQPDYARVANQSEIHVCGIEEFEPLTRYDYIISGLPLNNFPAELVASIFETYFRLLAPGGALSYFEYMYVRSIKKRAAGRSERERLSQIDTIIDPYFARSRFKTDWVFANVPPAWVQHLRSDQETTLDDASCERVS